MTSNKHDAEGLFRAYGNPELKKANPCPFCKNTALSVGVVDAKRMGRGHVWQVYCAKCQCRGPAGDSAQRAVAKWNSDFSPLHSREIVD